MSKLIGIILDDESVVYFPANEVVDIVQDSEAIVLVRRCNGQMMPYCLSSNTNIGSLVERINGALS